MWVLMWGRPAILLVFRITLLLEKDTTEIDFIRENTLFELRKKNKSWYKVLIFLISPSPQK